MNKTLHSSTKKDSLNGVSLHYEEIEDTAFERAERLQERGWHVLQRVTHDSTLLRIAWEV
jgi:hypothetical protein